MYYLNDVLLNHVLQYNEYNYHYTRDTLPGLPGLIMLPECLLGVLFCFVFLSLASFSLSFTCMMNEHTLTHTHARIHTHTYAHIHMHTHTYTHTLSDRKRMILDI